MRLSLFSLGAARAPRSEYERRTLNLVMVALSLSLLSGCIRSPIAMMISTRPLSQGGYTENTDPDGDCQSAIFLGVSFLKTNDIDPAQYRLILAENLIKGPTYAGPFIWRLIFKLRNLISEETGSEVGAGGELFLGIDLTTKEVRLLGHGE